MGVKIVCLDKNLLRALTLMTLWFIYELV